MLDNSKYIKTIALNKNNAQDLFRALLTYNIMIYNKNYAVFVPIL